MTTDRLTETKEIHPELVAPCGLNCRLCRAYMREKKPCSGCRGGDAGKPKTLVECRLRTCEKRMRAGVDFCWECDDFPCAVSTRLDTRYRTKYGVSPIENLEKIKKIGLMRFVREDGEKWACPECGKLLCVHEPRCLSCGHCRR